MLNLELTKKIAVTGGVASGKSTVCHFFEELGAYVLSADEIVHQLLVPTTKLGKRVTRLLGDDCVEGEHFNREKIAQKVFDDRLLLLELEKLIHPEVQRVIETTYKTISQQKTYPLFVVEIPLLYEAHFENDYDKVILVVSDEKSCKERFGKSEDEFMRRTQRLMPLEKKLELADYVIYNQGSREDLHQSIQNLNISLKENL